MQPSSDAFFRLPLEIISKTELELGGSTIKLSATQWRTVYCWERYLWRRYWWWKGDEIQETMWYRKNWQSLQSQLVSVSGAWSQTYGSLDESHCFSLYLLYVWTIRTYSMQQVAIWHKSGCLHLHVFTCMYGKHSTTGKYTLLLFFLKCDM